MSLTSVVGYGGDHHRQQRRRPEFRRIEEVARLFRISRSTAFRLMKEQGWSRHKFGIELRFSSSGSARKTWKLSRP